MPSTRLLMLAAGAALLAGCQTYQAPVNPDSVGDAEEQTSRMHIFIESGNSQPGEHTLVSDSIALHRAIKEALPDATILPDAGVVMNQKVSIWVENASLSQYLEQVGRAANVTLEYSDGVVTVSPVSRWNFILPSAYLSEAQALGRQYPRATVTVLESSDEFITILVAGPPADIVQLRTAIFQLSDQATLDRSMSGDVLGDTNGS